MFENNYWPKKANIIDVIISSAWTMMSWFIGSIFLVIIVFFITNIMDLPTNTTIWDLNLKLNNPLLPFVLSLVTFIITVVTSFINYYFLNQTESHKYKKSSVHFYNILLFLIIIYVLFAPIYVYFWVSNYENIIFVFIAHIVIVTFWEILLLELLNNYRYILIWFYWSFVWLILTSLISYSIFQLFNSWYARLLSLLIIMPLVNWLIVFVKWLFEILYYKYFKWSWNDNLWDIFKQIENEESLENRKNFIKNQNNI